MLSELAANVLFSPTSVLNAPQSLRWLVEDERYSMVSAHLVIDLRRLACMRTSPTAAVASRSARPALG